MDCWRGCVLCRFATGKQTRGLQTSEHFKLFGSLLKQGICVQ
jgi:hypothetical protein